MPLDTLPYELKLWVLKAAPDVGTLSALVRASPTFHAVYLSAREECLTQATLCDLKTRDVDILTPHTFIEVCIKGNRSTSPVLKQAIQECYRATQGKRTIKLSADECCALNSLTDLMGWDVRWEQEPQGRVQKRLIYPLSPDSQSTHALQSEMPRSADDYCFPLSDYKFVAFDPNEYPSSKPEGLPSLVITALWLPYKFYTNSFFNDYIACGFLISYEGQRPQAGDPEPGEPVGVEFRG